MSDELSPELIEAAKRAEISRARAVEKAAIYKEQQDLEAAMIAKADKEAAKLRAAHDANIGKTEVGGKLHPKPGEQ